MSTSGENNPDFKMEEPKSYKKNQIEKKRKGSYWDYKEIFFG